MLGPISHWYPLVMEIRWAWLEVCTKMEGLNKPLTKWSIEVESFRKPMVWRCYKMFQHLTFLEWRSSCSRWPPKKWKPFPAKESSDGGFTNGKSMKIEIIFSTSKSFCSSWNPNLSRWKWWNTNFLLLSISKWVAIVLIAFSTFHLACCSNRKACNRT